MSTWMNRRTLVIALITAVLLALIAFAMRPTPVDVDIATIRRGPIEVSIREEGRTRLKDVYVVSAPVAGRVLRLSIEVGDRIVGGETILATFEPSDPSILDVRSQSEAASEVRAAQAATELARAERDQADAERRFADAELARLLPLAEQGTISVAEVDRARLESDRARAALARANANVAVKQSQLEMARARLITVDGDPDGGEGNGRWVIPVRAPVDGRVMRILQESETVVAAGMPLLEVGDQRELEVVVELLSTDAVAVETGDPVVIERWGGPTNLSGVVRRVEPFGFTKISALGIEEQRVNTVVDITSPHEAWKSLGHGFRVEARIIIDRMANVLAVPISALFRNEQTWQVFVVDATGRVNVRDIVLGQRNQQLAEVTSGLSEGDRVVIHPGDRVVAGKRVLERQH